MNRKEFLSQLGIGAAFVLTSSCLGGCSKDNSVSPIQNVDFTLNLRDAGNQSLLQNGGYVIKNRVVVARTASGQYVAATQLCSHDNRYKVVFKNNEWFCTDHSARFAVDGSGLNGNGSKGLAIYRTELTEDMLRVFS